MILRFDPARRQYLQHLQLLRKYVLWLGSAVCAAILLVTESAWRLEMPKLHLLIQMMGVLLIVVCILGRTWCTLYIGRLKKQLVMHGPYSLVRNPLYVFTILGTAGVGAQTGTLTLTLLFGLLVSLVFYAVVLHEQAFLADTFGSAFTAYAERVPSFLPRFSGWTDAEQLTVDPALVRRTFRDALVFLLAVPANMLIEWLHDSGTLPVWLHLP